MSKQSWIFYGTITHANNKIQIIANELNHVKKNDNIGELYNDRKIVAEYILSDKVLFTNLNNYLWLGPKNGIITIPSLFSYDVIIDDNNEYILTDIKDLEYILKF